MEILRKVKCSERLPEDNVSVLFEEFIESKTKGKGYIKQYIGLILDNVIYVSDNDGNTYEWVFDDIEEMCWYEPIEIELNSEEILPKDSRLSRDRVKEINKICNTPLNSITYQLLQYHKALEAAELEIAELKSLNK